MELTKHVLEALTATRELVAVEDPTGPSPRNWYVGALDPENWFLWAGDLFEWEHPYVLHMESRSRTLEWVIHEMRDSWARGVYVRAVGALLTYFERPAQQA